MIKLELLLRHRAPGPELDTGLRAALGELGIRVLGVGRVTVTGEISPADFDTVFRTLPPASGRPGDTPALPIPAPLQGAVTLITVAPQHVLNQSTEKGNNAAI